MILGIDEVGRGPWAGPLVMGAVVLGGEPIDGLTDSKKLSKKRREELDGIIRDRSAAYGLGWVDAREIDEIGLGGALALACRRAVEAIDRLGASYHEIVIDGTINFLKDTPKGAFVTTMKKADLLVPSVSAASIIAKVARDKYMAEQDAVYEGYKFGAHVGYGTAMHRAAIESRGVTPLHRLSFAPLQKYRSSSAQQGAAGAAGGQVASGPAVAVLPSNHMGAIAEKLAAEYMQHTGHEVIERNWKTKYCEIDIISRKDGVVYFTEVKYRKQPNQGGGLAAITPKKLRQMQFAARVYTQAQRLHDSEMTLAAISLTGDPPAVESFVLIDSSDGV